MLCFVTFRKFVCKMEIRFVIWVFLVLLLCKECPACFQDNTVNNISDTAPNNFYEECCCTEKGYTSRDLQWLDPMNKVIGPGTDSNVYTEEQENNCLALHIPSTNPSLSGSYKCVTTYNGVIHSQTHNLDVFDKLIFVNTPRKQHLVYGTDGIINCQAKGAKPLIQWYMGKDDQNKIYNDTTKYIYTSDGILVRNVTYSDAGDYKCSASALLTAEEVEADIEVQVVSEPSITRITALPEQTVIAGNPLIIECTAEGQPLPDYFWRKLMGLTLSNENRNVTWQQEHNRIRIDTVEAEDAGIYECWATNFVGNTTQLIEIKVLVPPEIIGFNNRTVIEGSEILIHCNATGTPEPNVTVTYEGRNLEEKIDMMYEDFVPKYSLINITRDKEGFYICNASNDVDFVTEVMYLTVLHPPYFSENTEVLWGWNGEKVELNCEHDANPPSNITWTYTISDSAQADEKYINSNLQEASLNNMPYLWYNFVEGFAPYGLFECKAKNELGEAIKLIEVRKGFVPDTVANVTILSKTTTKVIFSIDTPKNYDGPPVLGFKAEYDVTENYNITHIHHNRTWAKERPYMLEKLKPKSTYFVKFAAINKVGIGPWSEMLEFDTLEKSVPEPPIWQVDAFQFTPTNVLKWTEPEDNGEPIDYYVLRYCIIVQNYEDSICNEKLIQAATEHEIDDLQYNTTYYLQLIAHNSEGNSIPANITLSIPASEELVQAQLLSQGAIIGISIVIVIVCLVLLDVLFLVWRRQGVIATCCYRKSKKKPDAVHTRDKKGLLNDNGENRDDTLRRSNNGHREFEYNKTTGIITGKHSSV